MGVAFATFADGAPGVANYPTSTSVWTEIGKLKTFLDGGIVAADVVDASLDHRHLYKPELFGFPVQGGIGQHQQVYGQHIAPEGPFPADKLNRPKNRSRSSLWPYTGAGGPPLEPTIDPAGVVLPYTMRTIRLYQTSDVELWATINAFFQQVWNTVPAPGVGTATYPSGGGNGSLWGTLQWGRRNHSTGVVALDTTGVISLYPMYDTPVEADQNGERSYELGALFTSLPAGVYDFYLWFNPTPTPAQATFRQFIVDHRELVIEVFSS